MNPMTQRMKKALERLEALPEAEQDRMAELLLHELAEDDRWARTIHEHSDKLRKLTDEIKADDAAGRCEPLDPVVTHSAASETGLASPPYPPRPSPFGPA